MSEHILEKQGVRIYIDEDPQNPRTEWDNITRMICFHSRYTLGDKHDYQHEDYASWYDLEQAIRKQEKPAALESLYMYDHSGLTIRTTPFNCPWDSGQIGFVLVTMETARKEFGAKRRSPTLIKRCLDMIEAEVRTYDQYLRGEVYGYVNENNDDSCWGLYGYDPEELADAVLKGEI